jgi:PIN domain nuclease of toxin-antitoxin system
MRLLLDTHVFLWCSTDARKLSKKTKEMIQDAIEVYVSSASIWEISIKVKTGKLDANVEELVSAIFSSGFSELPITAQHAAAVNQLADIHRDPFDRILLAQAIVEPLTFLTADETLKDYSPLVMIV